MLQVHEQTCTASYTVSSLQHPDQLVKKVPSTGGKQSSTHLHLVPRSRTSGDRPSLPPMFLWCEERNFTLYAADLSL